MKHTARITNALEDRLTKAICKGSWIFSPGEKPKYRFGLKFDFGNRHPGKGNQCFMSMASAEGKSYGPKIVLVGGPAKDNNEAMKTSSPSACSTTKQNRVHVPKNHPSPPSFLLPPHNPMQRVEKKLSGRLFMARQGIEVWVGVQRDTRGIVRMPCSSWIHTRCREQPMSASHLVGAHVRARSCLMTTSRGGYGNKVSPEESSV